jgi:hypothetical protein
MPPYNFTVPSRFFDGFWPSRADGSAQSVSNEEFVYAEPSNMQQPTYHAPTINPRAISQIPSHLAVQQSTFQPFPYSTGQGSSSGERVAGTDKTLYYFDGDTGTQYGGDSQSRRGLQFFNKGVAGHNCLSDDAGYYLSAYDQERNRNHEVMNQEGVRMVTDINQEDTEISKMKGEDMADEASVSETGTGQEVMEYGQENDTDSESDPDDDIPLITRLHYPRSTDSLIGRFTASGSASLSGQQDHNILTIPDPDAGATEAYSKTEKIEWKLPAVSPTPLIYYILTSLVRVHLHHKSRRLAPRKSEPSRSPT